MKVKASKILLVFTVLLDSNLISCHQCSLWCTVSNISFLKVMSLAQVFYGPDSTSSTWIAMPCESRTEVAFIFP